MCGAGALVYCMIVLRRARRQNGYVPVFENWLWHIILPMVAYAALLVTGAVIERNTALRLPSLLTSRKSIGGQ